MGLSKEEIQNFKNNLNATSTTPEDDYPRCPECGKVAFKKREDHPKADRDYSGDWYCRNNHHFDQPE